jgi:hypothetical protein
MRVRASRRPTGRAAPGERWLRFTGARAGAGIVLAAHCAGVTGRSTGAAAGVAGAAAAAVDVPTPSASDQPMAARGSSSGVRPEGVVLVHRGASLARTAARVSPFVATVNGTETFRDERACAT